MKKANKASLKLRDYNLKLSAQHLRGLNELAQVESQRRGVTVAPRTLAREILVAGINERLEGAAA